MNIILCNDVCFTHVTIINNLLTYILHLKEKKINAECLDRGYDFS